MLTDWLRKNIVSHWVRSCDLCHLPVEDSQQAFCLHCSQYIAPIPRCGRCGLPMPESVEACGTCLAESPPWQRLYCVSDYRPPLSGYIHRLKYQKHFHQAKPLAQWLAGRIEQPAPLITSVPLHWKRQWWRGYNQSELLAKSLAAELTLNYRVLFRRIEETKPQQGMDKADRVRNLRHAFVLNGSALAKHIAIVDDVVTTGSTVYQLSRLLLEAGVERVDIYCVCRTLAPSDLV